MCVWILLRESQQPQRHTLCEAFMFCFLIRLYLYLLGKYRNKLEVAS
jgi:hypothetical protein